MRRVVLYNPEAVFYTMPLALLAVASHLDPARFEVRIVDGRLEADPAAAVLAALGDDPVCLGVTALTGEPLRDAVRVSRAVRAARPDVPIVWGGWHPSLFPTETLAEPAVDVSVQSQGEATFRDVVERLAAGDGLDGVAGIASREHGRPDGRVLRHAPRPMVPLDELSPHRYDLLPVEDYFALKGRRQLDYIASAGCFWRCAFCADPFVFQRKWSGLAPERIADEVAALWDRYRFDDLAFQDETFFTYRPRSLEIAQAFLDRGRAFTWTATMRADQGARLSDSDFALLRRSGLRSVLVGVEAGTQEAIDWLQKDITLDQVFDTADKCLRHGLSVTFPFIVGFPNETAEAREATLAMAHRLRRMSPRFETPIFYFKPYPGSRITADVVAAGYELPQTLDAWADFDFVGSAGPWVSAEAVERVERFKFYNRLSGVRSRWPLRSVQRLAQWRIARDDFRFPVEMRLADRLRPTPRLS